MLQDQSIAVTDSLFEALSALQWTQITRLQFLERVGSAKQIHDCWMGRLFHSHRSQSPLLSPLGQSSISRLIERGFQLLERWPGQRTRTGEQWLGRRLFFGMNQHFASLASNTVCTVVSSQLGRGKNRLPFWPTLLESAIRKTAAEGASLLLVSGTTLYESAKHFARAAGVVVNELNLPEVPPTRRSSTVASWLQRIFSQCCNSLDSSEPWNNGCLYLSPELQTKSSTAFEGTFSDCPLQDRVAIALSDRVIAISVRPGGKISELLARRLSSDDFPAASVFICLPCYSSGLEQRQSKDSAASAGWLDRGAVGLVAMVDDSQQLSNCCRCCHVSRIPTLQSCCSLQKWLKNIQKDWNFLTHCTRGNSGPLPQESIEGFYRRIWSEGCVTAADPYLALTQILIDGRIRGSTWLTRGCQPTVSLSGVSLPELLSRRKYRNHLGRWDWEPYGLLFDRRLLASAKPVVYGNQECFAALPPSEQAYFQPADSSVDWSVEKEWRVIGDIDLRALSAETVTVFTRHRSEAYQLAALSPFPVLWVEE